MEAPDLILSGREIGPWQVVVWFGTTGGFLVSFDSCIRCSISHPFSHSKSRIKKRRYLGVKLRILEMLLRKGPTQSGRASFFEPRLTFSQVTSLVQSVASFSLRHSFHPGSHLHTKTLTTRTERLQGNIISLKRPKERKKEGKRNELVGPSFWRLRSCGVSLLQL